MLGGRGGRGEFEHDIAVADQLLDGLADRDADAPDPGELTDVLVDIAAARRLAAAGDRHTLRSPRSRRPASSPSGRRIRRRPSWSRPCFCLPYFWDWNGYRSPGKTQDQVVPSAIPGQSKGRPPCQTLDRRFLRGRFPLHPPGMALLRSVATVGSYTAMSRVFGFVRDILTAAILGAGPVADAFFVAQRLPNLFRSLFAEGAFSAAFVPLFAGTMAEHGKEPARVFAEDALAVLLAALLGFVLLGEIFMPAVMDVIAPGFRRGAGEVRACRRSRPDHLSLPAVHRAGGAAGRSAELGRPLRRRRGDPDPAKPVPDRRAVADAAVWLA